MVLPISIDNIRTALGASSYDLFTLGKSDQVNKWSKYKPFRHTQLFLNRFQGPDAVSPTSDREIALRASNYGLTPPEKKNTVEATLNTEWAYNHPVENQHWVDMFDFEMYLPGAVPPARSPGNATFYRALQNSFDFLQNMSQIIAPHNIVWADLVSIKDFYLAFYIKAYKNGVLQTFIKTSTQTIENGIGTLELTQQEAATIFSWDASGTYYYYLVASSEQNNTFTTPIVQADYMALPAYNTAAMEGTLKFSSSVIQNAIIQLVSNANADITSRLWRSFVLADDYTGPMEEEGDNAYFPLIVASNNSLHIGFKITGLPDRAVTLQRSLFTVRIDSTLWGTVRDFNVEKIIDSNDTEFSSITIPAGAVVTYGFILPYGAMNYRGYTRDDGVETGQKKSINVSLRYNGFNIANYMLRIRN